MNLTSTLKIFNILLNFVGVGYKERNKNREPMALTDETYPDNSMRNHQRMPIYMYIFFYLRKVGCMEFYIDILSLQIQNHSDKD